MTKRREELGLSLNEVSRQTGVPLESTCRVFLGQASNKLVWPIAQFLKMDWAMLHDFKLEDFRLAVVNGGSKR